MKPKSFLKGLRDAVIVLLILASVTVCCGTANTHEPQKEKIYIKPYKYLKP